MNNQSSRAFHDALSFAQTFIRRREEELGIQATLSMIEEEVQRVSQIFPLDFELFDRESLIDELIRRTSQSVGKIATLSSGDDHIAWLKSELKHDWKYWNRYRQYMEALIPPSALEALDDSTDEILAQLENPERLGAWDRRGLVVGHVQSGKTGNYTGLICKAADAGYKIIIVLAGLHKNLRSQTQIRLEEGFLGYSTATTGGGSQPVGVGLFDGDRNIRPNSATTRADDGDFNTAMANKMNVSPEQRPWLFVVKKNKTVLERLLRWIETRVVDYTDPDTGRKLVANLPLLVIDDESDHGSVDTEEDAVDEEGRPDLEHEPKTINRLIRSILHRFTRKAYVGYTATPFANIFIHEAAETDDFGPDLFPAAFITSLAAPSNYMGPSRIFGTGSDVSDDFPLIQPLATEEFAPWIPNGHKKECIPIWKGKARIPDSLEEAIRSFVYACAVRQLRGQGDKHASMLIHVTRFTAVQNEVTEQVQTYVRAMRGRYARGIDLEALEDEMRREYEGSFRPDMDRIRPLDSGFNRRGDDVDLSWEQVRRVIPDILSDIRIKQINGTAKDTLDYTENSSIGMKVIAIGGDKLARGLTLEGLCTSYFLRSTKMYDTLMQMGRWFGYRDGYLDVCRLYTSEEMIEWFGHIADAAEELRQEFDNMVAVGATPREFGLRVRSHSVLTVTSPLKMRNARAMQLTYSGDLLQTISFPRDPADIAHNFRAGERLLGAIGPSLDLNDGQYYVPEGTRWHGHLWRDVSPIDVTTFLRDFRVHRESYRVVGPLIAEFIEKMNTVGELTSWTVALIGVSDKARDSDSGIREISGHRVTMIQRKNRSAPDSDRYSIKTLISPRDQAIDLTEAQWKAALELSQATWRDDAGRNDTKKPEEPRGPQIRHILGYGDKAADIPPRRDRGLLMLYLIDPVGSGFSELEDSVPLFAWAVSFPASSTKVTVSNEAYIGNSVMWSSFHG